MGGLDGFSVGFFVSAAMDSGLASNCRTIQSHIEVHNNMGLVSAAIDSGLASNCRTIQSHIEVHNNMGFSTSLFNNVSSRISWTCTQVYTAVVYSRATIKYIEKNILAMASKATFTLATARDVGT